MRTLLLLLVAFSLNAPAQAAPSAPQDAVRAYFADVRSKGFTAAADHMHSAELARFKAMLLPLFSQGGSDKQNELRTAVFGADATAQSVSAASPREFMRAFLTLLSKQPAIAALQLASPELVGFVPEGELVHVISRTKVGSGDLSMTQMEVISLKKEGDAWRLMLNGSIEGIAQTLRQRAVRQR